MECHIPSEKHFRLSSIPISPKSLLKQEKRLRREIANSNERRRMQSINAGFESLRALLPHRDGEKLSKAAILQGTADYVLQLEQEKAQLMEQNNQLSRRMLQAPLNIQDSDGSCSGSPLPKRKKREPAESSDEGIGSSSPYRRENITDAVKRELMELKFKLEHERTVRKLVEQQLINLEKKSSHNTVDQIHIQYRNGSEDIEKCAMPVMSFGQESGIVTPQSPMSNQDNESSHEMSPRGSSPELSGLDVPEDLTGKSSTVLLPSVDELALSDINVPRLSLSTNWNSIESVPVELDQAAYKVRQNLEAIVEAIRHVEGDHMFRDDPAPAQSVDHTYVVTHKQEQCVVKSFQIDEHSSKRRNISFQHQIVENAPLVQSRPGVIVSNLS